MMLVLSRKLASRRKRDDQGTIGQLPAAVALLSYKLQQRQAADRRPTMIIMLLLKFHSGEKPLSAIFSPTHC